jgi:hypothetical protein
MSRWRRFVLGKKENLQACHEGTVSPRQPRCVERSGAFIGR